MPEAVHETPLGRIAPISTRPPGDARLIPASAARVLDVGCGAGRLGEAIKAGRRPRSSASSSTRRRPGRAGRLDRVSWATSRGRTRVRPGDLRRSRLRRRPGAPARPSRCSQRPGLAPRRGPAGRQHPQRSPPQRGARPPGGELDLRGGRAARPDPPALLHPPVDRAAVRRCGYALEGVGRSSAPATRTRPATPRRRRPGRPAPARGALPAEAAEFFTYQYLVTAAPRPPPRRPPPRPPWRRRAKPAALGCVLAVRDRPADYLERTLQTYAYQTLRPLDLVLLDYGSTPAAAAAYRQLCAVRLFVTSPPRRPRPSGTRPTPTTGPWLPWTPPSKPCSRTTRTCSWAKTCWPRPPPSAANGCSCSPRSPRAWGRATPTASPATTTWPPSWVPIRPCGESEGVVAFPRRAGSRGRGALTWPTATGGTRTPIRACGPSGRSALSGRPRPFWSAKARTPARPTPARPTTALTTKAPKRPAKWSRTGAGGRRLRARPQGELARPRPMRFTQDFVTDFDQFDFFGEPSPSSDLATASEPFVPAGQLRPRTAGPTTASHRLRGRPERLPALNAPDYYVGISDGCCDRESATGSWSASPYRWPRSPLPTSSSTETIPASDVDL